MEAVTHIQALLSQGRFAAALRSLADLPLVRSRAINIETLRLELLERTGNYAEADILATRLLRSRALTDSQQSVCEFCLGVILWDRGQTQTAIGHFQRSVSKAVGGGDLWRTCWAQLRLLVSTSGQAADPAAGRLLQDVRKNVVRLGDPMVSAALHIFLGEIEAKRGLLAIASRHTKLGQSLLKRSHNIWLEALAENNLAAVSIMRFDLESGVTHAERALELATESGAAAMMRAATANLGNLHHLRGDFSSARNLLRRAYDLLPSSGEHSNGSLDGLARTYLAEGEVQKADVLLSQIEGSFSHPSDRFLYANRHALLTRIEYLMRAARWDEALPLAENLIEIARSVGDKALEMTAYAKRAEVGAVVFGAPDATTFINSLADLLRANRSPNQFVEYELAVSGALCASGQSEVSVHHSERALRTYQTLGCKFGVLDASVGLTVQEGQYADPRRAPNVGQQLQELASLLMHSGRPELVATGLIAIVQHTGAVSGARAVARAADNSEERLADWGTIADPAACRTFAIGTSRDRSVELLVQPLPDVESQTTVNSIGFIIAAGQEIERARIEREERLTLWPVDELPAEDDDSVVAGRMRDVMLYARKIAQSTVIVLITGESGTGKEVLARAIHRYSPRSRKPFVPFNCTAVPRELLESHLFGFKRGAFTGADRDNPGLIRAAKDGTLFLDEIGELSLDLQPKLLRFLESGEINPLGEPSPFSVNVRIVAATNANLKRLVEEGRFREDLYYRLSVVPMELPPLRERREEIAPLAQHFALKWSHELGKGCIRVAEDLMEHLVVYHWPGNIRQLSNEINRMIAIAEPDMQLTLDHFPRALREETEQLKRRANGLDMTVPLNDKLDHAISLLEREMIKAALRDSNGKVEAAAKALGISRKGLYLKRQRLGL
jgi:DNA-binding NtrC family response regulator/tetratricopeptide (TPR) repeat protein